MVRGLIFVWLLTALPVYAAQTLRDAVERAWLRQPAAQTQRARVDELDARREAARAAFPEPPSMRIGNRNDRLNHNQGSNEWEAELALPLWLPGERVRQTAVVDAEQNQYDVALAAAKLKVAGEVREAFWQARLADNEVALARRKVEEAATLASDVERRVKAGDLARIDFNQARGAEAGARAALTDAQVRSYKARRTFEFLTGMAALPSGAEKVEAGAALDNHPQLASLQRVIATAHAKLAQVQHKKRDNPELELGVRRERGAFDDPYRNALMVRFRLPFATDARNRPRVTAANAELIEAQAAYQLEHAKLAAEGDAARREAEEARTIEKLVESRFRLAEETQRLQARAFALGELDLVSRLRVESERFEAELAFSRTQLEAARAVARLNQALGVLP